MLELAEASLMNLRLAGAMLGKAEVELPLVYEQLSVTKNGLASIAYRL